MDTTINTSAELFRQIGYIADDESSMKKLLSYVRKLVKKKKEESAPVMTREEILEDFKEALKELKASEEGCLELKTLEEFRHELREEGYYD